MRSRSRSADDHVADAIPFHLPSITEAERSAVLRVLESGWLTTGDRVLEFEAAVAAATGVREAVAVNSATAALHLALEALGVGPADEVIVPTYTFAACGEVVRYLGARPKLVDIDPVTLNVTPEIVAAAIDARTKAVIVVHFGGLMADVESIVAVAGRRGVSVVEDAAHALPAFRSGRAAGSVGDVGALSFYATKTVTTAEGGMLLTDRPDVADRARIMRLHGISRDAWKRYTSSGSWYYEIEEAGFKYNLTDLAAAIGLAQLARAEELRTARERIASAYLERLGAGGPGEELDLPALPAAGDVHAWHLFPVRIRTGGADRRARIIERLRDAGIGSSVHFIPLHIHPYYRRTFGYQPSDLPVAVGEYEREISLPIYPDLTDAGVDRVSEALRAALEATR